ncbi:small integral membrane protein 30-like [Saimiri boliviensis]|uniref:small integral membrane protein 30-like n=1 Tax=Saimiri boliviensis TaxID=27679 RepID=UPI003D76D521
MEFYIYHFFGTFSPQDSNITPSVSTQLSLVLRSLVLVLPVVEAGAGDVAASGVVLSITGIRTCLGAYAQRRNGQM